MPHSFYDVIIIGTGAGGLGVALSLPSSFRIAIISKDSIASGSSPRAQGGIAAVLNQSNDKLQSHVDDTLQAGGGLCDIDVVKHTVYQAKNAIEWLLQQGVPFSLDEKKQLHCVREGGHQQRRVLHVADHTGSAIIQSLDQQLKQRSNIDIFEHTYATQLLCHQRRCTGVMLLDASQTLHTVSAHVIVLATGGASSLYLRNTSANQNYGDGIAMAYRVGCRVANMEFMQFHPTVLATNEQPSFLISEVVRGEGGLITNHHGERFLKYITPQAELAPRDVVSRTIFQEMQRAQLNHVDLDITHLPLEQIKKLFPTIYQHCLQRGLDISKQKIPVAPAAHYTCGGVMTDITGRTDISNLYAVGEVAYTGLHGANRIASNSLLECIVFARQTSESITEAIALDSASTPFHMRKKCGVKTRVKEKIDFMKLKHIMWNQVGIIRDEHSLLNAKKNIGILLKTAPEQPKNRMQWEYDHALTCALLIVNSALQRKESRGCHTRSDYENANAIYENPTILQSSDNPSDGAKFSELIDLVTK